MTWARRCAVATAVAIASTSLTGCGDGGDPTRGWDEPANYSATIRYQAYDIDAGEYYIVVREHEVVAFVRTDNRGAVPEGSQAPDAVHFTLRQIVGMYQTARADRESREAILFDDQHMPTYVTINWEPYRITDEQSWYIEDLKILDS